MAKKKKKNKKTPAPLLREQIFFAIKANDSDVLIQEEDSIECPGARSYVTAINTTTNKVPIATNNKEDNNFRNFTSLGKAETKSSGWSKVVLLVSFYSSSS